MTWNQTGEPSKRKPHNEDAGYIAEKIFKPSGSHLVIYLATEQGLDAGWSIEGKPNKYAIVCSLHSTLTGTTLLPKAREIMKAADFCEDCMSAAQ